MGWTALIVDDSNAMRSLLRAVLESKGVKVLEADNGCDGLQQAREHDVDVMIVDVHMPVMDGLKMVRAIRALPQHRKTPVFVLTSDATSRQMEEGRQAGATAWVVKTTDPELLWRGIEKMLNYAVSLAPEPRQVSK
jgi:two-component system chemotaxis response regulator CheY